MESQRPSTQSKRERQKGRHLGVQVWGEECFEMTGLNRPMRFIRFVETITETVFYGRMPKSVTVVKEVWVITTFGQHVSAQVIWEMIHKRWDLENNGFRELKIKWHMDHCFMHDPRAIEVIVLFIVLAFNLFQLYLFQRVQGFRKIGMAQSLVVEELRIPAVASESQSIVCWSERLVSLSLCVK